MNTKPLWLLAAALILTASACQNTGKPEPQATEQPSTQKSTPAGTSSPIDATPPAAPAPVTNSTAGAASFNKATSTTNGKEAASAQTAVKLYRMNPKSYDIVPIDPNSTEKKVVLLTFDDGPKDHDMLESILNTLDKHKAKAIFFVNGYRVKQKPELLKLILDHGQTLGNHSWDHIDLKKESKEKVAQQIDDVQQIVKDTTGVEPQFFRPPFGSGGDEVRAKVKEHNMLFMTWSNGSLDWEMSSKNNNPDKIVSNVLEQLRPGSNILMHELPWTDKALDKLLLELESKQYGFVDPATIDTAQ